MQPPSDPDGPGVVLGRESDATLVFGTPLADPDVASSVRVPLPLRTNHLTARHDLELEPWGDGVRRLIAFLEELSEAWRGWSGVKEWSDDHQVTHLRATHDGLGTVALEVSRLGQFPETQNTRVPSAVQPLVEYTQHPLST
ncbi:MAG: DUF6228 family protein [Chloroflexota bacterium]|nr:DUF6228 family protein [Chloroflexota bacterium]